MQYYVQVKRKAWWGTVVVRQKCCITIASHVKTYTKLKYTPFDSEVKNLPNFSYNTKQRRWTKDAVSYPAIHTQSHIIYYQQRYYTRCKW